MELGTNTECTGERTDDFRCVIKAKINQFPMLNTYSKIIQSTLGPTNYVRNFESHQNYLEHCIFLPYLNNEKDSPRTE